MEVVHQSPVVDSEVFSKTTLKSTIVSKTLGRIEFTPNEEDRWRVPFPHPEIDSSAKADFTVESSQSGLLVTYKGIDQYVNTMNPQCLQST